MEKAKYYHIIAIYCLDVIKLHVIIVITKLLVGRWYLFDKKAYDKEYHKRTGYAAQKKYERKMKAYTVKFNIIDDKDVIEKLDSVKSKTDYWRRLIRDDLKRNK